MPDSIARRIVEGVRWRADAIYSRVPRKARVWLENLLLPNRVRRGQHMFDRERLIASYRRAWELLLRDEPASAPGHYVEFGVYYGSSMACMYAALEQLGLSGVHLFGFDSFAGLPPEAATEADQQWIPGQFQASRALAEEYLERQGVPPDRVTLTEGWFEDTLTPATAARLVIRRAGVLMVDCDIYTSARQALAFSEPLIGPQAIIYFDDWNAGGLADRGMGERRAFEEFLAEHPDLQAEPLEGFNYKDKGDVKVFRVRRVTAPGPAS